MNGRGSQKQARLERLMNEIEEYVASQPNCSAADIVNYLSNERKMRNHGLTTRKLDSLFQGTYPIELHTNLITQQAREFTALLLELDE